MYATLHHQPSYQTTKNTFVRAKVQFAHAYWPLVALIKLQNEFCTTFFSVIIL